MTSRLWLFLQRGSLKKLIMLPIAMCPLYFSSANAGLNFSSCTVSLTPINFGSVDPMSDALATSTVTVTCTITGNGSAISLPIALTTGSGSYATRTLKSNTNTLNYNIYTDSARSIVWGNGNGGTSTSTVSVSFSASGSQNATLYGKILSQPKTIPGTYTDTVTASVTY